MSDDALSQANAETLLRMSKKPATADAFSFPDLVSGRKVSDPVKEALLSYDITPIVWSKREEFRERLVA